MVGGGRGTPVARSWARKSGSSRSRGPDQAATQAFCSLSRLCTVQAIVHSDSTAASPRRKNWRKPRACLSRKRRAVALPLSDAAVGADSRV